VEDGEHGEEKGAVLCVEMGRSYYFIFQQI